MGGRSAGSARQVAIIDPGLYRAAILAVAPALSQAPLKVGEYEDIHIETPHPYPLGAGGDNVVWRDRISHPGATYISVHFGWFDLAPGDFVAIYNPRTGVRHEFRARV